MEKILKKGELPFSCREIFNAVSDVSRFPQIFPSINRVTTANDNGTCRDVHVDFNVPPALSSLLGGTTQDLRVTSEQDKSIRLVGIKGPMKHMEIRWTFDAVAANRTAVTFEMDYDVGRNFVVNKSVKAFINQSSRSVVDNLEKYVRKVTGPKG